MYLPDTFVYLYFMTKKIIIVGATSGIGLEVAKCYIKMGWRVGVAGRREEALKALQRTAPEQVVCQVIDVTQGEASVGLSCLIEKLGGMDLFLLSSGIGSQNRTLEPEIELNTVRTNAEGFARLTTAAYNYFTRQGKGHLAVISSIAGTKGIGVAPAYSATKRFQNTYIDALAQLSRMNKSGICFTDIRPGFVATDLLKDGHYPMLMDVVEVAAAITRALNRRKRVVIIDGRYRFLVFIWKLIPRWLWERLPVK